MRPKLTVVMTALDEGVEVDETLASIRETAGDDVEIVFVNDASTDGHPYRDVAEKFGARYFENEMRMGCARARDIGVAAVTTPMAMLIDSHMRFHHDAWWIQIADAIEHDPRAIYCTCCDPLDVRGQRLVDGPSTSHAARIELGDGPDEDLLEPKWLRDVDLVPERVDVPCVLGATYAFDVSYYQKLGGLAGLRGWGMDEPYLSMKAWLEGGRCRLLTRVLIGHKFKEGSQYKVYAAHTYYNKLFLCETLLPRDLADGLRVRVEASARRRSPEEASAYERAAARIASHGAVLSQLREHFASMQTRSFDQIVEMNERAR